MLLVYKRNAHQTSADDAVGSFLHGTSERSKR
jgi:hypothetical protein